MMLANTKPMLNDLKLMTDVMVDFVNADSQLSALRRLINNLVKPGTGPRISITSIVLYQMTAFPLGAIFQFKYLDIVALNDNAKTPEELGVFNVLVVDGKLTGSFYGM